MLLNNLHTRLRHQIEDGGRLQSKMAHKGLIRGSVCGSGCDWWKDRDNRQIPDGAVITMTRFVSCHVVRKEGTKIKSISLAGRRK